MRAFFFDICIQTSPDPGQPRNKKKDIKQSSWVGPSCSSTARKTFYTKIKLKKSFFFDHIHSHPTTTTKKQTVGLLALGVSFLAPRSSSSPFFCHPRKTSEEREKKRLSWCSRQVAVHDFVLLSILNETGKTIGQVLEMWEDRNERRCVRLRRYYMPEDTGVGRMRTHEDNEVFESELEQVVFVEDVLSVCKVVQQPKPSD